MRNICMATACVVVVCVCIAGAVILKGDSSSSSSSSSVVTTYGLSAAVSLNGITAAQFDSTAQASFRSTVANQFSVSSSAVTINSYSRRAVAVDFTVALATRPTAANATALTNFITSSGSNGLVSQLNIALSSTNSSATITSVTVTRSVAVVGRTANGWGNVPTSAPTSAPTLSPTPSAPTGVFQAVSVPGRNASTHFTARLRVAGTVAWSDAFVMETMSGPHWCHAY